MNVEVIRPITTGVRKFDEEKNRPTELKLIRNPQIFQGSERILNAFGWRTNGTGKVRYVGFEKELQCS